MNIILTNLTVEEIARAIIREMDSYFAAKMEESRRDAFGGIDLAMEITGLAKPTIYGLVSKRKIPHSKRGKKLYFSKQDLNQWINDGERGQKTENKALEPETLVEGLVQIMIDPSPRMSIL